MSAFQLDGFTVNGFEGVKWAKASRSNQQHLDDCVAVALLPDGSVGVAHTKHPEAGAQVFTKAEFAAFLDGARKGEFDHFVV